MVVFGGFSSTGSKWNDTWSLDLSGATGWTRLASTAPFSGRAVHSAICDPRRDRMVVFGGLDSRGARGDLWALSFADLAWSEIVPADTTRAPARYGHSAIYDDVTDRMLIIGGPLQSGFWSFSLGSSVWSRLDAPAGALQRVFHAASYDAVDRRMLVFGGSWVDPYQGDAWAYQLDLGTWSQVIPASQPPRGRAGHVAIYDPLRQRMIVQGGYNAECECFFHDTWQLSLGPTPVWSPLATVGPDPVARAGHVAVYDPAGDRMIIFGGEVKCEDGEYCSRPGNDAWALSLGTSNPTWVPLSPAGELPSARSGATAVYDPLGRRMVVYGGFDFYTIASDVWALELSGSPAWTPLATAGMWPGVRVGHSAIYEPVGRQMVVFGGFGAGNETLALELAATPSWRVLVPGSAGDPGLPPPRGDHSAVYDPAEGRMLLYGYDDGTAENNDAWALSLGSAPTWSRVTLSNSPPVGRVDHAAIYDPVGHRMLMHAGGRGYLYDTWVLQSEVGIPTPVALSLVSATVKDVGVELEWFSADAQALEATLYRRTDESEWRALASVSADGTGHLRFVDRASCEGARACYRLGYLDHGVQRFSAETWVELPGRALELAGLSPNPALGELLASFSLASAAPARLSLLDVTGRAVAVREVGSLGPGRHTVALGCSSGVPAGVYWLRLAQGGRSLSVRGVVMR
ncbi:MAG: kelch repeat-containing protein [Candidatus Eisenbacteria bacterium]